MIPLVAYDQGPQAKQTRRISKGHSPSHDSSIKANRSMMDESSAASHSTPFSRWGNAVVVLPSAAPLAMVETQSFPVGESTMTVTILMKSCPRMGTRIVTGTLVEVLLPAVAAALRVLVSMISPRIPISAEGWETFFRLRTRELLVAYVPGILSPPHFITTRTRGDKIYISDENVGGETVSHLWRVVGNNGDG